MVCSGWLPDTSWMTTSHLSPNCAAMPAAICFSDPNRKTTDEDIAYISRLCDQNNVPFASNLATAEMLVLGLDRGDLDWRDIVNPKSKPFTA